MEITSIMMVTYNRLELTKQTLKSFFDKTKQPFRLIIVDNNSTDGSVEYLQSIKPTELSSFCVGYDLELHPKNLGIGSGRNKAMKIADQYNDPWLCTADNDIELIDNWLEDCINVLKKNSKFAVGLNMEGVKYPLQTLNGAEVQFKKNGNLGTALTVFPRQLHTDIGFFNTEFGLYGEEDADFFIRSRVQGYQLGYLPNDGIHLGVGEYDTGEYREWKTKMHAENLEKFRAVCYKYYRKEKPIYTNYTCNE